MAGVLRRGKQGRDLGAQERGRKAGSADVGQCQTRLGGGAAAESAAPRRAHFLVPEEKKKGHGVPSAMLLTPFRRDGRLDTGRPS